MASPVLCTFPGRAGDILWALPTVRAISEATGAPVDLQIAGEFHALRELLELQPYIGVVYADVQWGLTPPDEWRAPVLGTSSQYPRRFHLGYRGWPPQGLAQTTYALATELWRYYVGNRALPALDLRRPWITVPAGSMPPFDVCCGWTDEHFELKFGLSELLTERFESFELTFAPHSRWATEATAVWRRQGYTPTPDTWLGSAQILRSTKVFVGCCSALHVLAVAMGVPVIVMEPSVARQNPIFYPCGMDGEQVRIVRGGDGQPTWDASAVAAAVWGRLRAE